MSEARNLIQVNAHCCVCQVGDCIHGGPVLYCAEHRPNTATVYNLGRPSHLSCTAECPCYWRGRRDEAKA